MKRTAGIVLAVITVVYFLFVHVPCSFSQEVEAWTNLGLYGGQVYDLAVDPLNPNKMFAGTYMGDGLFVTKDGGNSWNAVETEHLYEGEDTFRDHAVWAVEIAPTNSDVVWVAHNQWVEVSADGGETWAHIFNRDMQRDCEGCGGLDDAFRFCMSLAVDPSDARIVYVGASGPYGGYGSGAVYRTGDGGATWVKMNLGNDLDFPVVDIEVDPQDPETLWAVTSSFGYSGWGGTLYRSTTGGETWESIYSLTPFGSAFLTVAVKPDDPTKVFTGSGFGIMMHYLEDDVWKVHWPVPESAMVQDIAFDPQNPNVLYAVWKNPFFGDFIPRIARSENGGIDWEITPIEYEFLAVAVHPTQTGTLFGGDVSLGVWRSLDSGQTWTEINEGISAVIVNDVDIDPNDSTHLLAGTFSGVYERKGDGAWNRIFLGSAASLAFHPTDSLTFYAGMQGYLAKTADGGETWSYSNWLNDGYNYVNDIAVDPTDTDIVYAAVRGLSLYGAVHQSRDGGASFVQVLEGENESGQKYNMNAVVVDPSDSSHLFAGGGNFYSPRVLGDLWESRDGGDSWSRTGLKNVIVNAVLIDPTDPSVLFAGCGFSGGTDVPVYKSTDGGSQWIPSFQGIPGFRISIKGVWGSSGADVFSVASGGAILHYDGADWTSVDGGTTRDLYDVWGSSGTDVFAVGAKGTILHYDGADWTSVDSGTTETLRGVAGTSATDLFVVGDLGTLLHYDGQTWAAMDTGTAERLSGVWANSPTDVFAVGGNGTILHYDGSDWSAMASGTNRYLNDVWGSSATGVYVVGEVGQILRYDGTGWVIDDFETRESYLGIWGTSGSDVFAVGDYGSILHYNGSGWAVQREPGSNLNAVTDMEFHKEDSATLYASTLRTGVYVSPNRAANWANLGTPANIVQAISTSSLYAATEGGMLQCTGTGVLTGTVTDLSTGEGIHHATVFTDLGGRCMSFQGEYMMIGPAGISTVGAAADGYANATLSEVAVYGGDVTRIDILMESGLPDPDLPPGRTDRTSDDGGGYCFIATAAYGSPLAGQVRVLRDFRDAYLLRCGVGRRLVDLYYRYGPAPAGLIEKHRWLKPLVRGVLYPTIGAAWLCLATGAMEKAVVALLLTAILVAAGLRFGTGRPGRSRFGPIGFGLVVLALLPGGWGPVCPDPADAQTVFRQVGIASSPNPVGSGARAMGMAGAFIAIADDATAASWNPGGLVQVEKPEVSAVGAYFSRNEELTSGVLAGLQSDTTVDGANLNYLSVTYPFHLWTNWVVSLNYQRLYDFERELDYTQDFRDVGLDLLQDKQYFQDGYLGALGIAAAVEILPRFSLGVTFNLWTDELFWRNGWEEDFTEQAVGTVAGEGVTIDTQIRDKYEEFRGINFNVGLLWNPFDFLTVGAVVKTPFTASVRHEFSFRQVQTFDDPAAEPITTAQSITENVDLKMPISYGIGIAGRISDALSVDLDVYRTHWSDYILEDSRGNEFSPIDGRPEDESDVEDTTMVRLGAEYLFILENKGLVVPVRGGFFYDPEPAYGSVKDFFGFAVGSGIAYKWVVFDLAYQLRWGTNLDTGNLIAATEGDIMQHNLLFSLILHLQALE